MKVLHKFYLKLQLAIKEYVVNDHFIDVNGSITLTYWYDAYSMKRMHATYRATIVRNVGQADKFKMTFKALTDVSEED